MSNSMFKQKKVYFSQVSNHALRDNKLSLKAKGLYSLIQSYITIPDFILYKQTLQNQCKEGDTAFDGAWKELKDNGYLLQERKRNADARTFYYIYELLDEPYPCFEGVGNVPHGKEGVYNNTDLSNTELNNTKNNGIAKDNSLYTKPFLSFAVYQRSNTVSEEAYKLINEYELCEGKQIYAEEIFHKIINDIDEVVVDNYIELDNELAYRLVRKYLSSNFKQYTLLHLSQPKVLIHRLQEIGAIGYVE